MTEQVPLIKHFEKELADGKSWTEDNEWSPAKDVEILFVSVARADGAPWGKSKITFKFDKVALTDPESPCYVFTVVGKPGLQVDWKIPAKRRIVWEMKNEEGVTITVYVDFVYKEVG